MYYANYFESKYSSFVHISSRWYMYVPVFYSKTALDIIFISYNFLIIPILDFVPKFHKNIHISFKLGSNGLNEKGFPHLLVNLRQYDQGPLLQLL